MSNRNQNDKVTELREAFALFDKDGDGTISINELKAIMNTLGQNPTKLELQDIINEVDINGNGAIDFTDFLVLMERKTRLNSQEEELKEAFSVFDQNGDGVISIDELRSVMEKLGEKLSDDEISLIIHQVDSKNKGIIDFDEFVQLMTAQ